MREIRTGDAIKVSRPVAITAIAVMLAREQFGLRGDLQSDAASVLPLTLALARSKGLRFMRDPTRGGIATVMHEIVQATGLGVHLDETQVPVRDPVRSVCEMLAKTRISWLARVRGMPSSLATGADTQTACVNNDPADAAIIGRTQDQPQRVILRTPLGGERVIEELEDDPLPRIC